jgi:hypothetical protein
MFDISIWDILAIIALSLLVVSIIDWRHSSWLGVILGVVISIPAIVIRMLLGNAFTWELPKKILIVTILIQGLFQMISRLSKSNQKKISR